jgi:HD-like signal output (HDOD) protein
MDVTKTDPGLFHEFYTKLAMPLKLPPTSRKILSEFVDIDVNSEKVSKIIQENQYVEYILMQQVKSLSLKEGVPSLKAAIVLLGMQGVRNFVCAMRMVRLGRSHITIAENGKLDFKPSDHLKYALKAEEYVSSRRLPYGDTAYAAGMMFDLVVSIGHQIFKAEKDFDEYVAEVFKQSLKGARVGVEITKSLKGFGYSKYVFGACMIRDIGKLAMYLLHTKAYKDFLKALEKKPLPRVFRHVAEAKLFGMTHEYYGAQMAHSFDLFQNVERAVLFHHDPYLIKSGNKELYTLTMLLSLSSNVAGNFRTPKDLKDPIFASWLTPEVKDFKIEPKLLMDMMLKIGRDSY